MYKMKKQLYSFLGPARDVLWVIGFTSLIVLNMFKYFGLDSDILIEILPYSLSFSIVGSIFEVVRLTMNRHFEYEEDEGLL